MKLRRTAFLTKLLIALVVLTCTWMLMSQQAKRQEYRAQAEALEQELLELREENRELQENLHGLGTEEGIRKIARDELGLVGSNEILLTGEND